MSLATILVSVAKRLEAIQCRFEWGESDEKMQNTIFLLGVWWNTRIKKMVWEWGLWSNSAWLFRRRAGEIHEGEGEYVVEGNLGGTPKSPRARMVLRCGRGLPCMRGHSWTSLTTFNGELGLEKSWAYGRTTSWEGGLSIWNCQQFLILLETKILLRRMRILEGDLGLLS